MKVASALLALVLLAPLGAKDAKPPVPVEGKTVVLDPLEIKGSPTIAFAIDITIYRSPETGKVSHIFIRHVWEDTDAERAGLLAGDEIVKLDGVPVTDFEAKVSADSALGQVFLNRRPGDQLKLEVITRRTEKFVLHAQRPLPDPSR